MLLLTFEYNSVVDDFSSVSVHLFFDYFLFWDNIEIYVQIIALLSAAFLKSPCTISFDRIFRWFLNISFIIPSLFVFLFVFVRKSISLLFIFDLLFSVVVDDSFPKLITILLTTSVFICFGTSFFTRNCILTALKAINSQISVYKFSLFRSSKTFSISINCIFSYLSRNKQFLKYLIISTVISITPDTFRDFSSYFLFHFPASYHLIMYNFHALSFSMHPFFYTFCFSTCNSRNTSTIFGLIWCHFCPVCFWEIVLWFSLNYVDMIFPKPFDITSFEIKSKSIVNARHKNLTSHFYLLSQGN